MKHAILFIALMMATTFMDAQVKTPARSPKAKVEQQVGLTDISIEYSRPSMKGRSIYGGLVPYDKMWRTGANKNTMITFSEDVKVGGQEVAAGSYAIYTTPSPSAWEVVLYSDTKNWGTPREWSDDKVAAKFMVDAQRMPMKVETFTITFDDLTNSSANIGLLWSDVYVPIPVTVGTDDAVEASIAKVMSGPAAGDYFSSAVYYLDEGKDINKAKMWIDHAVEMTMDEPKFWYLRQQSLIHAKAGSKDTAIAAARKSLELAEKAGNMDYVKMNKASLMEWGGM